MCDDEDAVDLSASIMASCSGSTVWMGVGVGESWNEGEEGEDDGRGEGFFLIKVSREEIK